MQSISCHDVSSFTHIYISCTILLVLRVCVWWLVPSTIVSVVECSYPTPEDASVGFLYIGANIMAIVMTFTGQILLTLPSPLPAPFFPFGIWMSAFLLVILVPILTFSGQYLRLVQDQ